MLFLSAHCSNLVVISLDTQFSQLAEFDNFVSHGVLDGNAGEQVDLTCRNL